MRKFLINTVIISLLFLPVLTAHSASPFIVCDPEPSSAGAPTEDCDFYSLIKLTNNIINFLVVFSTALAAVVFAYAGFTLVTSGGSEDKMKKAKAMFSKTAIGFVIVLGAWLLVSTIMKALLGDDSTFFLLK